MSGLGAAIRAELLKSRRSRVPWGVAAGFSIVPLISGLFMVILQNPEAARSLGLLGTKAALSAGSADWPTFLSMLGQAVAIGGAILFGFLMAWVFGREFADRTVRNLLAVPTPRPSIVIAKMLVFGAWAIAIAAWVIALALAVGAILGLPGWNGGDATASLVGIGLAALLTIGMHTLTAFFASVGRGYLVALAWVVATIVAAQVIAVLGWGNLFPWAVPAILAGAGGAEVEPVGIIGVIAVLVVAIVGALATVMWWERADQSG